MNQRSSASLQSDLLVLANTSWIDRQTAAVFLEFSIFNPNVNLFQSCLILFEINSGGSFVVSSLYTPIDLNEIVSSSSNQVGSAKILLYVLYLIFICILLAKEVKDMIKMRWSYFRVFYNYIDLLLVAFSWSAFAMYLYRVYSGYGLKSKLANSGFLTNYINLQLIASWNQLFIYFIGICVALGTIRFLKVRFIIFLIFFSIWSN